MSLPIVEIFDPQSRPRCEHDCRLQQLVPFGKDLCGLPALSTSVHVGKQKSLVERVELERAVKDA